MSGTDSILTAGEREAFLAIMRGRKAGALKVRRADALVAPGDGNGVGLVCRLLHPGPDTVRGWLRGFGGTGLAPVDPAAYPEREGKLTRARETSLRETLRDSPPRDTNGVRDIIQRLHGVEYTRGGAIKLMHRPGFGHVRPKPLPRQADRAAQEAFMRQYERTVRDAPPDGAIVFADAVHPEWQSRPAHGRVFRGDRPAVRSTTGRRRLSPQGALDLETMGFTMVEGERTGATTTLRLLRRLERARPGSAAIHVFPGNARQHHAKAPRPFLERPDCRVRLHFLPPYAPHLNPIERLWGVMHRHVTHNRFHADLRQFTEAIFRFFDETLPREWEAIAESVTDSFRVITHDGYRMAG